MSTQFRKIEACNDIPADRRSMVIENLSNSQESAEIARLRSQLMDLKLHLEDVDQRRRVEAQMRRDLMTALTRATGIDQSLEIILVNLRNLVPYDVASLFLVSRDGHLVQELISSLGQTQVLQSFPYDHPIVADLEVTSQPLVIQDVQSDSRFENWEEMRLIKGWMGIPIRVDGVMIGFLSLGSLQPGTYQNTDTILVSSFANQLSEVLAETWRFESPSRKNEELEVITRISHALGQAESREATYMAILEQMNSLFGPTEGAFLFPDNSYSSLVVKFALDEACLGLSHSRNRDLFWQVLDSGETASIPDITVFLRDNPVELYCALLKRKKSAILIPLKSQKSSFGILLLAFPRYQNFKSEDYRIFDTIAQIASTTLRRLLVLEALEKQLSVERERMIKHAEQAAVMEERQRLARELHDSVTQLIYSQVLYAGAGLKVLNNGDTSLSYQYLSRIHQVAQQALKEMRLLVYELRPRDFLEDGLVGALRHRLDSVERRSEINAQLVVHGQISLDETTEIALYYISMEALNNILKHSGASSVTITLHGKGNRVSLEVADDGCGFDVDQIENNSGLGLISMRERALACQGDIQVISRLGEGTRIIAVIEASK